MKIAFSNFQILIMFALIMFFRSSKEGIDILSSSILILELQLA